MTPFIFFFKEIRVPFMILSKISIGMYYVVLYSCSRSCRHNNVHTEEGNRKPWKSFMELVRKRKLNLVKTVEVLLVNILHTRTSKY